MSAPGSWYPTETTLPPLEKIVIVRYRWGIDDADVYAWGARIDEDEGWLWGIQQGYSCGIHPDKSAGWNDIEADDDYQITHWMDLPEPPAKAEPSP